MSNRWKFVKNSNSCWWVVISELEQLFQYKDLTDHRFSRALILEDDKTTEVEKKYKELAEIYANRLHISLLKGMTEVSARIFEGQTDAIMKGKTIYINENGGYNLGFDVEKTVYRDNFLFPNYTEKDIKVTQWGKGEGFHWYARVGNIEVRDGDTMKWDTFQEAYDEAMKYCDVSLVEV